MQALLPSLLPLDGGLASLAVLRHLVFIIAPLTVFGVVSIVLSNVLLIRKLPASNFSRGCMIFALLTAAASMACSIYYGGIQADPGLRLWFVSEGALVLAFALFASRR